VAVNSPLADEWCGSFQGKTGHDSPFLARQLMTRSRHRALPHSSTCEAAQRVWSENPAARSDPQSYSCPGSADLQRETMPQSGSPSLITRIFAALTIGGLAKKISRVAWALRAAPMLGAG
jgi:hypothetical protein